MATRTRRYVVVLLLLLAVLFLVSMTLRGMPVEQPVAFDHQKHTKDLELSCELCHNHMITGTDAGLPGAQTCALCHQAQQAASADSAGAKAPFVSPDSLRFNKLFRLPEHVYFSHRRHVGIGKLECGACHGDIAVSQQPPSRALVRITMEFCLDCHRAKGQSLDCVACHR